MLDEPADPLGNGAPEIWQRQMKRWLKRFLVVDIAGAIRKPQPNGGVIYQLPSALPPASPPGRVPFSGIGAPGPTTLTGGSFSAGPVPSLYVDMTTPTNPVMYVCVTAGTAATSVWGQIGAGAGGNYGGTWNAGVAYFKGTIVRVTAAVNYQTTGAGNPVVTSTVGVFGCVNNTVPAVGAFMDANSIPQFPEPTTGTVHWECVSLAIQPISVCQNGNKTIYIQSTAPF